jgi:hypothetical protein
MEEQPFERPLLSAKETFKAVTDLLYDANLSSEQRYERIESRRLAHRSGKH